MKMPEDKPYPPGGPPPDLPGGEAARRLEQFLEKRFSEQPEEAPPPVTFLSEEDLKTEFNLTDPALIGAILDRLLAARQAGEVSSLEEAFQYVTAYLEKRNTGTSDLGIG